MHVVETSKRDRRYQIALCRPMMPRTAGPYDSARSRPARGYRSHRERRCMAVSRAQRFRSSSQRPTTAFCEAEQITLVQDNLNTHHACLVISRSRLNLGRRHAWRSASSGSTRSHGSWHVCRSGSSAIWSSDARRRSKHQAALKAEVSASSLRRNSAHAKPIGASAHQGRPSN